MPSPWLILQTGWEIKMKINTLFNPKCLQKLTLSSSFAGKRQFVFVFYSSRRPISDPDSLLQSCQALSSWALPLHSPRSSPHNSLQSSVTCPTFSPRVVYFQLAWIHFVLTLYIIRPRKEKLLHAWCEHKGIHFTRHWNRRDMNRSDYN